MCFSCKKCKVNFLCYLNVHIKYCRFHVLIVILAILSINAFKTPHGIVLDDKFDFYFKILLTQRSMELEHLFLFGL